MRVVRDWVGGEIELPAGLCNPRREADAELALEKLVPSYSKHRVKSGSKQVDNINPQSEAKSANTSNRKKGVEMGASNCNTVLQGENSSSK
jgi:hypothetical protein